MPAIQNLGQVAINVRDLDRAVGFYRDILELSLLFQVPGLAFFQCGEVRLMLSPPERKEYDHPGSVLYYRVADLDAAHACLVDRGVTFEAPPHLIARMPDHELWMAFAADTEGNTLALMCEVR